MSGYRKRGGEIEDLGFEPGTEHETYTYGPRVEISARNLDGSYQVWDRFTATTHRYVRRTVLVREEVSRGTPDVYRLRSISLYLANREPRRR